MIDHLIHAHEGTLIGRDPLLTDVKSQMVVHRLLTLTGPGGVGKTRIAQHLATALIAEATFADGVRWVDLAAVSEHTAVLQAIAHACGISERRDTPWIALLTGALQSTHRLLILDNCEQLRTACADICMHLLVACPQIHILATSREPLRVPSELRVPISPLDPAAAVALFGMHATARLPALALTDVTMAAITTICTYLDGVPLAIELAAARVTLLSVTQIAARMGGSLHVLASRDADRPPRQRSLRAVLDWSYTLLHADEQTLFGQLAIFPGSFAMEAVEAVCLGSAPLDTLAGLVAASLVSVTHHDTTVRYRLHEVVRQYATERLQATDAHDEIRMRHLAWVIALVEQAERNFLPADEKAWIAQLALEHDNIRSALQTADDRGEAASILRVASALAHFWNSVSLREGRTWLARGRARAVLQPGMVSVKAWNTESFLAYRQGDYDSMHAAATIALHEALLVEYAEGIAAAHYRLGIYAEMKGNTANARDHYTRSLAVAQELGDRRVISQTLNGLAHVAKLDGDVRAAQQYYRQGLALARADRDHLTTALLLISLANLTLDDGDLDVAAAAYAESLIHLDAANNTSYRLYAINGLGEVAHYRQDFAGATDQYQAGLHLARTLGLKDMEAQFLAHVGRTATQRGDYGEAARCLSEALRLYLPLERPMRTAGAIHFCADLVVRLGYPAQATVLFVAGLRAVESEDFSYLGSESTVLQASLSAAYAALDQAEYTLAVADGAALTLGEAADLALSMVFLPQRPLPTKDQPELHIVLFGHLRVLRNGRTLTGDDWVYTKTKDLLLFLLLVESADKKEIGAALWPDASAEQLRQNFRMAIYHLRRALGRTEWITFVNGRYTFNHSLSSWVDVAAFERAVEQSRNDPAQRINHLRTAVALYTGDLTLGDLESDMLLLRRERLHQQALAVLLDLGRLHEDHGQHREAVEVYRRALALDGYSEVAHRGLMRSLARLGETAAALVHYDHVVALLAHDLGLAPNAETTKLGAHIKGGVAV